MGLGVLDKSHNKSHSQDDECEGIAASKKGKKRVIPKDDPSCDACWCGIFYELLSQLCIHSEVDLAQEGNY